MLRFLIFFQVICALDCIVSFVDLIWLTIWLIIAFSFWLLVIMTIKLVTAIVVQIWGKIIKKKFESLNDDIIGLCEFIYKYIYMYIQLWKYLYYGVYRYIEGYVCGFCSFCFLDKQTEGYSSQVSFWNMFNTETSEMLIFRCEKLWDVKS